MMVLEQGELIEADFTPAAGHEPLKMRPALVVSVGFFNNVISSLTVVCPITSTNNGHPLHVPLKNTQSVSGCICLEQLRAVDLGARKARKLDEFLDEETMAEVLNKLGAIFGI